MKCSDGDNEYYGEARKSYEIVTKMCGNFEEIEAIADLGLEVMEGLTLFGADMLHLLKNARTRLLTDAVSPNLQLPRKLSLDLIKKHLDVPKECWDNSDLNKMVDALPITMFTFKNVLTLFDAGLDREAMYFLLFALFQGFFRADCDYHTRICIGVQFLRYARLYIDYGNWTTANRVCRCTEVRRSGGCLTLFTECHLQRMIVTVTVVLSLMLVQPDETIMGLDRCSTHPLENFFGLLRVFCSFKHTYTNILDKIARTQYIRMINNDLGLSVKVNKRLNIAGQRVMIENQVLRGSVDADFAPGMMYLIDSSYTVHILGINQHYHIVRGIMRGFLAVLSRISMREENVQGKYSGIQILNRLIANSRGATKK